MVHHTAHRVVFGVITVHLVEVAAFHLIRLAVLVHMVQLVLQLVHHIKNEVV